MTRCARVAGSPMQSRSGSSGATSVNRLCPGRGGAGSSSRPTRPPRKKKETGNGCHMGIARWRPGEIVVPRQGQDSGDGPVYVNASTFPGMGSARIKDHRQEPEATFDRDSSRDGTPQAQSEVSVHTRTEGHVRPVTDPIEQPVAQNNSEDDPCSTRVAPFQKVSRRQQTGPYPVHQQTVAHDSI